MASKYPLGFESKHLALEPGMRRVIVDTASTAELKDLASLRSDFRSAHMFLDHYLASNLEGGGPGTSDLDALWIAAVTMYGRAFSNGKRHAGRPNAEDLSAEDLDAHTYFLGLRNKYIAHAVNGFEKGIVFADLQDPAIAPGISRVGESHTSLMRISRLAAATLSGLCDAQVKKLNFRIEALHRQVATEVIALGAEEAYALPEFTPPVLDGSNPFSPRT